MRGEKQRMIVYGRPYLWITPACAGKSGFWSTKAPEGRDHPRMRGEKVWDMMLFLAPLGSPPHARGKADMPRPGHQDAGITPACAGKRRSRNRKRAFGRDHPRMRGEKSTYSSIALSISGSPPHARGKVSYIVEACPLFGITPACAGKRGRKRARVGAARDHPRMRGEKSTASCTLVAATGSPPHARGKVRHPNHLPTAPGITPACAGKRLVPIKYNRVFRDHPRMRGEKCKSGLPYRSRQGSPPHARGKVKGFVFPRRKGGITPACAGKSSCRTAQRSHSEDHPRMRGEKSENDDTVGAILGSPPHARGKE